MMKSTLRLFIIIFCVLSSAYGCFYKKVDSLSLFKINGKIIDSKNRDPIEGASILFVDVGFDEHKKESGEPIKICESSNKGDVICSFEYFWGRTEGMFVGKPSKKFFIKVEKNTYHSKKVLFDANSIRRINGEYQVFLGEVLLEK